MDVNLVLGGERPVVIDEWNKVPKIWDAVRRECDKTTETGNYFKLVQLN